MHQRCLFWLSVRRGLTERIVLELESAIRE